MYHMVYTQSIIGDIQLWILVTVLSPAI